VIETLRGPGGSQEFGDEIDIPSAVRTARVAVLAIGMNSTLTLVGQE
jgi:hypothetical protein